MIFDHRIKYNGKWYNAGEEVPESEPVKESPAIPPVKDNVREQLSKDEVLAMKYFTLKALADKQGIVAKGKKMPELQKEVLEALGL